MKHNNVVFKESDFFSSRRDRIMNKIYLEFNGYLNKEQERYDLIQELVFQNYINYKNVLNELKCKFYEIYNEFI
jgi:hypothetical protein